jgi:hypothetical protein
MFNNLNDVNKIYNSSKFYYINIDQFIKNNDSFFIFDVYKKMLVEPIINTRVRHSSVGGCAIINKDLISRIDGLYVSDRRLLHDIPIDSNEQRYKCFSDVRFRQVYGKNNSVFVDLPHQFHLNHSQNFKDQK